MKKYLLSSLVILMSLSTPAWSEDIDDLVERDGLYFKKFTQVPFTGKVTGHKQGSIKDGKRVGSWVGYWSNGQLHYKGEYSNGIFVGEWVWYYDNGQLRTKGKYNTNDLLNSVLTSTYGMNGYRIGEWVTYNKDGILISKEIYE